MAVAQHNSRLAVPKIDKNFKIFGILPVQSLNPHSHCITTTAQTGWARIQKVTPIHICSSLLQKEDREKKSELGKRRGASIE